MRAGALTLCGVLLLAFGVAVAGSSEHLAAWLVVGGFLLVAGGALQAGARMAALIALLFAVYGGLSAAVALSDLATKTGFIPPEAEAVKAMGVFTSIRHTTFGGDSFRYALLVTSLGGLAAVAAARLGRLRALARAPSEQWHRPALAPDLAERAGLALIAVGLLGIALAGARFVATDHAAQTPWESLKSLWTGGSYALLLVFFGVPGFGLWLHALLRRRARTRELIVCAAGVVLFGLLSLGTGQRGILLELALVIVAVLVWHRVLPRRQLLALAAVGVIGLGLTQAVRNAVRETGTVTPGNLVSRLKPDNLEVLFGSQLASFQYTWEIAEYRRQLDIPNSFVSLLLKPVPRQLAPDKSQGFGDDFTRVVHPTAHAQDVTFATPLVAESDYDFGPAGVVLVLGAFGLLCGYAEVRLVTRAPSELQPVLAAGLIWVAFSLVRGDLANALFVAAGWALPLAAVCIAVGFTPERGSAFYDPAGRLLRRALGPRSEPTVVTERAAPRN